MVPRKLAIRLEGATETETQTETDRQTDRQTDRDTTRQIPSHFLRMKWEHAHVTPKGRGTLDRVAS